VELDEVNQGFNEVRNHKKSIEILNGVIYIYQYHSVSLSFPCPFSGHDISFRASPSQDEDHWPANPWQAQVGVRFGQGRVITLRFRCLDSH
jgi:hypothetical protein